MNADGFRHLYDYHFTINRKIWNECVAPLSQAQFLHPSDHSVGSVRNQVVHMLNIDDRWFSGLRGEPVPDFLTPEPFTDREVIRQKWDAVEARMRAYLQSLTDERLEQPAFDQDAFPLWQLLIHVANHGTDHRAQLMALLHQLGVATFPQDYFFYMIGRM